MKSITKKISLLLLLSTTLFFSSCLDSGDSSYYGNDEYSYITQSDAGRIYARTASSYLITSAKINTLTPGTIALLTYQVDEESEIIKLDEYTNLYNVRLGKEPIILNQESIQLRSAPEEEDPMFFESIIAPPAWVINSSEYFGDRWPFTLQYKAKKGENVKVSFYRVPEDELPENLNADVLIDIRIKKSGTPDSDANNEQLIQDLVVANMSQLRDISSNIDGQESASGQGTKDLRIKFRFYRADKKGELHISETPVIMAVKK